MKYSLSSRGITLEAGLVEAQKQGVTRGLILEVFKADLGEHAIFMRMRARSHRRPEPFLVGAAAIGFTENNRPILMEGANYSPNRGDPRDCGEMDVDRWATFRGVKDIARLAVASNGDVATFEAINGLPRPTIDLCSDCRELYSNQPASSPTMVVDAYNIGPDGRIRVRTSQMLANILDRYRNVVPPTPSQFLIDQSFPA